MPGWVSPWEIILLLIFALLLFGAKKLPEMGRSLGTGMREFKNAVTGKDDDRPELSPPAPTTETTAPTPARETDTV
jgi:sec-independent protein translocase protein TatA